MSTKKEQIGEVVRVSIDSVSENPINFQIYSSKHTKEDEDLENSIQLYGQLEACLVNSKTNQLISGHRRYNTIKRLGIDTIDVIYKSVDELEIIQLIQSNRYREKSLVEKINEYRILKSEMKSLPLVKRKKLMSGLKLRDYLHKQIGVNQSSDAKLKIIEDYNDDELLNSVLSGEISVKSAYTIIKGIGNDKSKFIEEIKKSILKGKDSLTYYDVLLLVGEVYKRNK